MDALSRATARIDRLRSRLLWHRRPLAALAAAVAVYLGLHAATAPPPATVELWTAAHDLPSGTVLTRADLVRRPFTPQSVPAHRLHDPATVVGRTVAAPITAGAAVTPGQFVGAGWLADRPGMYAVPVRVTDPGVVRLLRVGDQVSLLASDPQHGDRVDPLNVAATVLAVPSTPTNAESALSGRLVVFGVDPADAQTIATASASRYLTVVWNH